MPVYRNIWPTSDRALADCANTQCGVIGVDALEVPSQDTSVIKSNQDCDEKLRREDHKSITEVINLPRESLQKMFVYHLCF
jgi:hypothetical protein